MHKKTKGFTLIELLVVVLIIAILAAVALPMYKRSVAKSRLTTAIPVAKAVANAQEVYFMNENAYATDQEQLDITVPTEAAQTNATISTEDDYKFVLVSHKDFPNAHYIIYQNYSKNFPGNIHCEAKTDDSVANWVCEKGLGEGTLLGAGITPEFTTYILQGSSSDGAYGGGSGGGGSTPGETYYDQQNLNLSGNDGCVASTNYGCYNSTFNDNASCKSTAESGCFDSTFNGNSSCEGSAQFGCTNGTFNDDSSCEGSADYGCFDSKFYDNSVCVGSGEYGCQVSLFKGNSSCVATANRGCRYGKFNDNSYCVANVANGCQEATYKGSAYCTGAYCPAGSPKQGGGTW